MKVKGHRFHGEFRVMSNEQKSQKCIVRTAATLDAKLSTFNFCLIARHRSLITQQLSSEHGEVVVRFARGVIGLYKACSHRTVLAPRLNCARSAAANVNFVIVREYVVFVIILPNVLSLKELVCIR